jgi:single-stranded-DNA-specific exonuclease
MEIKNLKKAAKRILEAIEKKERILLYGDADLDGICSTIILKETINSFGGETSGVYFPDREKEGYGISRDGLNFLKNKTPALLIALDCGISNFKEVEMANEIGFEIIIIDHHEVLEELPKASIIVDPKQKGDSYPFKNLATVGIVFKLAQEILKDKMSERMRQNFLELVALATLADMMPQERENKLMTDEGLELMKKSWRPAFKVISQFFKIPQEIQKAISILNVRDIENNLPASYRFLISENEEKARVIFERLIEKGKNRKKEIKKILEEVESQVSKEDKIIFVGDKNWNFSVIPAVASQICQIYQKPTFVFKIGEKETQGTVRAPQNVNTVELMKKCKKLLISFGGHPQASGFRLKNENLEKFKKCLVENL